MQLVRLPESQRDPAKLEAAHRTFMKALRITEEQLRRTRFISGERFTYGNIPLGIRVHRMHASVERIDRTVATLERCESMAGLVALLSPP